MYWDVWILLGIVLKYIIEILLWFWFLKTRFIASLGTDYYFFNPRKRSQRVHNADIGRNILSIKYYINVVVGNLRYIYSLVS